MSDKIKAYENNSQVMSYTPEIVLQQKADIQNLMSKVMKKDEHYGTIPGCGDKPTLLKSGAETINFMFRLAPAFDVERIDMPNGHREYIITTTLTHIPTGDVWGQGVGSCSTMESKYRFRMDMKKDDSGRWCQVPKEYWKDRDPQILGGPEWNTTKKSGKFYICRKVEHDNPPDYYNTVLKIGKKRSLVDADLTATAASDFFTQDIEDLKANGLIQDEEHQENMRDHETLKQKATFDAVQYEDRSPKVKKLDPNKTKTLGDQEMTEDEFNNKLSLFEHKMLTYFEGVGDSDPAKAMYNWMMKTTTLINQETKEVEIPGIGTVDGIKSAKRLNFLKSQFIKDYKISKGNWEKLKEDS